MNKYQRTVVAQCTWMFIAFMFVSTSYTQIPPYLPTNGLVGWWPFNGNANDESGNGFNGVVTGASLSADRNGTLNSCYEFLGQTQPGTDNTVVLNDQVIDVFGFNPVITNQLTISLWSNTYDSNIGAFLQRRVNNSIDYACGSEGVHLGSVGICSNINITTNNEWHFHVYTYNGSTIKHYVDGQEVLAAAGFGSIGINTTTMNFGKYIYYGGNTHFFYFNGKLDDIAIYNRALTQEEITALYTGSSSNNGGGNGGTVGTPAASVPAGIPYQAVIRDNAGAALVNAPVTVRFTLHQNTTDGTVEYEETQSLTTNTIGLINTQFGSGTANQGTFANINWSNTTKFIQVEANTGAGYVDMGTQQMMSVPFAIKSNESNKIKNAGLPVYADNAAALAGGLVAGEMYRTAAGILMIVF